MVQSEPPSPSIECESDLKFVWINSDMEDVYKDFCDIIKPASATRYEATELVLKIRDDWANSCIFLCLSANHARDLLPRIHDEAEVYRVYILCQNEAEEDAFQNQKQRFIKIRIATTNGELFIRQLANDVVPLFVKLATALRSDDMRNAFKWYESAAAKANEYGDSETKSLVPTMQEFVKRYVFWRQSIHAELKFCVKKSE